MSNVQKLNISLLKNEKSRFNSEKTNFNNVAYSNFNSSYIKTCSDNYIKQMSDKLSELYKNLNTGYNSINNWWNDYTENIEALENYLSGNGSSGSISESSVRAIVSNKTSLLEDYKKKVSTSFATSKINKTMSFNHRFSAFASLYQDYKPTITNTTNTSEAAKVVEEKTKTKTTDKKTKSRPVLNFIKKYIVDPYISSQTKLNEHNTAPVMDEDYGKNDLDYFLATTGTFFTTIAEGIASVGEKMMDSMAIMGTMMQEQQLRDFQQQSMIMGLVDEKYVISNDSIDEFMDESWKGTSQFVEKERVKTKFNELYENELSYLKDNSIEFDKVRMVGNGIGYSTGVLATSALTGTPPWLIAGTAGFGTGAETAWNDGAEKDEALAYALANGTWEAVQYKIGQEIGGNSGAKVSNAIFGKITKLGKLSKFADSTAGKWVSTALTRMTLDGLDGGVEAFAIPTLQLIYKEGYIDENGNEIKFGDDAKFGEKWNALFAENGGWSYFWSNALVGGVMSFASEVPDGIKAKLFGEYENIRPEVDVDVEPSKTEVDTTKTEMDVSQSIDDTLKLKQDEWDKLNEIVNSEEYLKYMDNARKGYAQVLRADFDGIETRMLELEKDISLAGVDMNLKSPLSLDDFKYKKQNVVASTIAFLQSNFRKYVYNDTSSVKFVNETILNHDLYHFTDAADAILDSGYIKASDMVASYGNRKTFFFAGVPEVGAFATNLDTVPLKTTAVRIEASVDLINDPKLKVRNLDDGAITYDGKFDLNGKKATTEYFCLFKENDELVYKPVSKDFFDTYESPELSAFLKNKKHVQAIKDDYLINLSLKNTNAKISNLSSNKLNFFDNEYDVRTARVTEGYSAKLSTDSPSPVKITQLTDDELFKVKQEELDLLNEVIKSEEYLEYMDNAKKGYAQVLRSEFEGVEKRILELEAELNAYNIKNSNNQVQPDFVSKPRTDNYNIKNELQNKINDLNAKIYDIYQTNNDIKLRTSESDMLMVQKMLDGKLTLKDKIYIKTHKLEQLCSHFKFYQKELDISYNLVNLYIEYNRLLKDQDIEMIAKLKMDLEGKGISFYDAESLQKFTVISRLQNQFVKDTGTSPIDMLEQMDNYLNKSTAIVEQLNAEINNWTKADVDEYMDIYLTNIEGQKMMRQQEIEQLLNGNPSAVFLSKQELKQYAQLDEQLKNYSAEEMLLNINDAELASEQIEFVKLLYLKEQLAGKVTSELDLKFARDIDSKIFKAKIEMENKYLDELYHTGAVIFAQGGELLSDPYDVFTIDLEYQQFNYYVNFELPQQLELHFGKYINNKNITTISSETYLMDKDVFGWMCGVNNAKGFNDGKSYVKIGRGIEDEYTTACHEAIHGISNSYNGIISGVHDLNNESTRGINEAITEYLNKKICPTSTSGYDTAVRIIANLVKSECLSDDLIMNAYFGNNLNLITEHLNNIVGYDISTKIIPLFDDVAHHRSSNSNIELDEIINEIIDSMIKNGG